MSRAVICFALLALIAAVSAAQWGEVRFIPSNGYSGISGWAYFSTNAANTSVTVTITGLATYANTPLGIHIHQFADMVTMAQDNTFEAGNKTFATHWVGRGNTTFGCPETNTFPGFRAGCLGNWQVDANGVINQTKYFPAAQLSNGFYVPGGSDVAYDNASPIGLGMILHALTDPCNGTSTLYGARLAGGVIGVARESASSNAANTAKAYVNPAMTTITATCRLFGTTNSTTGNSGIRGSIWIRQASNGATQVRAIINGFPGALGTGGARSMHIHDFGDLTDQADAGTTGSHWNPTGSPHALPPQEPRHAGDLGRITIANSTGSLFYNYVLVSSDPSNNVYHPQLNGMYSVLGRGIILHAGIDVGCLAANSAGNAGVRAAQCVVGLARDEVWDELLATWNTLAPTEAQSVVPQPGDICTPPRAPPAPVSNSPAHGVFVSFAMLVVAALVALLF